MRWKAPSERTQVVLLSPIWVPALAIATVMFAAPVAIVLGAHWLWNRYGPEPKIGWHSWFAWRPVHCGGFFYDQPDRWVWLERIEARYGSGSSEYRLPEWQTIWESAANA